MKFFGVVGLAYMDILSLHPHSIPFRSIPSSFMTDQRPREPPWSQVLHLAT